MTGSFPNLWIPEDNILLGKVKLKISNKKRQLYSNISGNTQNYTVL